MNKNKKLKIAFWILLPISILILSNGFNPKLQINNTLKIILILTGLITLALAISFYGITFKKEKIEKEAVKEKKKELKETLKAIEELNKEQKKDGK